jgi:hypothetical protein
VIASDEETHRLVIEMNAPKQVALESPEGVMVARC